MSRISQAGQCRGGFQQPMNECRLALWYVLCYIVSEMFRSVQQFCANKPKFQCQVKLTWIKKKQYDQRVRDAIAAVPEGGWKEFANYAGPGPDRITGWNKVVLIGDASHPLHGMSSLWCDLRMEAKNRCTANNPAFIFQAHLDLERPLAWKTDGF